MVKWLLISRNEKPFHQMSWNLDYLIWGNRDSQGNGISSNQTYILVIHFPIPFPYLQLHQPNGTLSYRVVCCLMLWRATQVLEFGDDLSRRDYSWEVDQGLLELCHWVRQCGWGEHLGECWVGRPWKTSWRFLVAICLSRTFLKKRNCFCSLVFFFCLCGYSISISRSWGWYYTNTLVESFNNIFCLLTIPFLPHFCSPYFLSDTITIATKKHLYPFLWMHYK